MSDEAHERQLVEATLRGDARALRELVEYVAPIVRVRVARVLHRYRSHARSRDVRQEVDDLAQEALVALVEKQGQLLRSWNPERGLSLRSFLGLVTERLVRDILVSKKRTPWSDDPTEDSVLDAAPYDAVLPDRLVTSKDFAARLLEALSAELSPLAYRVFSVLYLEELDVDAACATLDMSAEAIYTWRKRLTRRVREVAASIDPASEPRMKPGVAP